MYPSSHVIRGHLCHGYGNSKKRFGNFPDIPCTNQARIRTICEHWKYNHSIIQRQKFRNLPRWFDWSRKNDSSWIKLLLPIQKNLQSDIQKPILNKDSFYIPKYVTNTVITYVINPKPNLQKKKLVLKHIHKHEIYDINYNSHTTFPIFDFWLIFDNCKNLKVLRF